MTYVKIGLDVLAVVILVLWTQGAKDDYARFNDEPRNSASGWSVWWIGIAAIAWLYWR